MDYPRARIVWISDLEFEIEPELSAADLARFMIASPEYHAAQKLWKERNEAAGTFSGPSKPVVLRPGGVLSEDLETGGPVDPETSRRFH